MSTNVHTIINVEQKSQESDAMLDKPQEPDIVKELPRATVDIPMVLVATNTNTTTFKQSSRTRKCIILLIVISIISFIPAIQLFSGWYYSDKCPVDWHIPYFLIVSGSGGLIIIALSVIEYHIMIHDDSKQKTSTAKHKRCGSSFFGCGIGIIIILLIIFLVGWCIVGYYWLFKAWFVVQFIEPTESNYCDPLLYRMSYGIISICISFLGCCFCGCLQIRMK